MLESLGRIQHPFTRSLTAAATVGSAVTLAAAIALGVTHANDESAYRTAVHSALAGTVGGAILGLLYVDPKNNKRTQPIFQAQTAEHEPWKDWRDFVVVRKVKESEEITSFYLKPEDQRAIPNFQPGQFLTIKLDIPGQKQSTIRTYSLSDYTEPCEYYRISVKREPMPPGSDFMPGIASNFLHDHIHEGAIIPTKPPGGRFVLDVRRSVPAVLVSNGVGVTPMISMVKAATRANPSRAVWFVHGAKNGRFHAFRNEVIAVAQQNSNLSVHFAYSRPGLEDREHYHHKGYVDTELLQSLVPLEAEYFLCGSPAFMQSLREGLEAAGIPNSRIFFEAFTKKNVSLLSEIPATSLEKTSTAAEVVFAESNQTATWQTGDGSLLEFAEANHLEPLYSCRQGICGTCTCKLLEGEVEYLQTPVAAVDDGSVLICISRPKTSRVVLGL